jgi:7-carboxy-7-deazaguanine synthase
VKGHAVSEIFGPTIQGEGELQGMPAYFVRFGGCEFRCDWCDTPHAVLPHAVRATPHLTSDEIIERLKALPPGPRLIVLTGGNPVLHELDDLVNYLHHLDYLVSVETQGAKFRPWITRCDSICVSPKPPSALLHGKQVDTSLDAFMSQVWVWGGTSVFFKVVVFDQKDYEWARSLHHRYTDVPMFLSAGNDAGRTVGNPNRVDDRTRDQVVRDLLTRTRWLTNYTMVDPDMKDVRVQSQQHVLLWGNERGH